MTELLNFVIEHGYLVVFIWIALDQAGLPLPAIPLLLIAGVLIGLGEMSLGPLIAVIVLASVPIDYFWYWLGRLRGARVLHLLCILSLEPDYCVRNTEKLFRRLGPVSLIIGKFVPGLQTLAPPMSGMTGVSLPLFLVLDTLGTILWASLVIALGYYFHNEIEYLVAQLAEAGFITGSALIGIALGYLAWKLFHRQKFVRSLRMRRVEPNDLYERIQKGEDVHILDLRHDYDVKALPHLLPNALRVPMEAIERHKHRIPKESDIVLCCN